MAFETKELMFSISLAAQEGTGPERRMEWKCFGPTCTQTVTDIKIIGDPLKDRDNLYALKDALIAMLVSLEKTPRAE